MTIHFHLVRINIEGAMHLLIFVDIRTINYSPGER